MNNISGQVHSILNGSCADGPGLRSVIFLSGCNLACNFCHNIDVVKLPGKKMSVNAVLEKIKRVLPYIKKGGVTISGGEPFFQAEFCLALIMAIKKSGLHVAVETNGTIIDKEIIAAADLLIIDIKNQFLKLESYREIFDCLKSVNKKINVTNVLINGVNDGEKHKKDLQNFLKDYKDIILSFKYLPFVRTEAEAKWKMLGLPFKI